MRALAIMAFLPPLWACSGGDQAIFWTPPDDLSWSFDPRCEEPTDVEASAIARGAELWRQVGVHTLPIDDAPDVWICLTPGAPRPGFSGWQDWDESGTARASVSRAIVTERLGTVVAHELGHVILPGSGDENHLPPGQVGILAAHADGSRWSPADEDFLAGFGGFIPVVVAR